MLTAFGLAGACATEPPPPPPPPIVEPITFMVFFDWDSTKLSDVALRTIGQATGFVAERIDKPDFELVVTGYADTSGTPQYNMALSLRRANAVKDALVRDGVPARMIRVIGRGEEGLLVATADGVREPQNRRVQLSPGYKPQPESADLIYCRRLVSAYYVATDHPKAWLWRNPDTGGRPTECLDAASGIRTMERALTDAGIPLPSRPDGPSLPRE